MAVKFGRWPRTTLARFVVFTAAGSGIVGAIVGLVIGLTYPPTAAIAVIELGLPSAVAGAFIGVLLGSLAVVISGVLRSRHSLMSSDKML